MSSPDVDYIVKSELKTALSTAIPDWPIRWANEQWPIGTRTTGTTAGNLPVDADGLPVPCIQAGIEMGDDSACPGLEDNRVSTQLGLLKVYFLYPQGWGDEPLLRKFGDLRRSLKRRTIQLDESQWQRLTVMDPSFDKGGAVAEDGTRYVRTVTWRFWFNYRS
jgi:hypothetical protein